MQCWYVGNWPHILSQTDQRHLMDPNNFSSHHIELALRTYSLKRVRSQTIQTILKSLLMYFKLGLFSPSEVSRFSRYSSRFMISFECGCKLWDLWYIIPRVSSIHDRTTSNILRLRSCTHILSSLFLVCFKKPFSDFLFIAIQKF